MVEEAEQREERQLFSCFAIPLFKVYFTDLLGELHSYKANHPPKI